MPMCRKRRKRLKARRLANQLCLELARIHMEDFFYESPFVKWLKQRQKGFEMGDLKIGFTGFKPAPGSQVTGSISILPNSDPDVLPS